MHSARHLHKMWAVPIWQLLRHSIDELIKSWLHSFQQPEVRGLRCEWKLCCHANGSQHAWTELSLWLHLFGSPKAKFKTLSDLSKFQKKYQKKIFFMWFRYVKRIQRVLPVQHIYSPPRSSKIGYLAVATFAPLKLLHFGDPLVLFLRQPWTLGELPFLQRQNISRGYPSAMFHLPQDSDPNFQRSCSVLVHVSNLDLLSGHRCLFTREKQLGGKSKRSNN